MKPTNEARRSVVEWYRVSKRMGALDPVAIASKAAECLHSAKGKARGGQNVLSQPQQGLFTGSQLILFKSPQI